MNADLQPTAAGAIDTARVTAAMRRADRKTALARIAAYEITAIQTAKLHAVGDVTREAIDEVGDLVDHARCRGSQGDPAKALAFAELLDDAKLQLGGILRDTGRHLR